MSDVGFSHLVRNWRFLPPQQAVHVRKRRSVVVVVAHAWVPLLRAHKQSLARPTPLRFHYRIQMLFCTACCTGAGSGESHCQGCRHWRAADPKSCQLASSGKIEFVKIQLTNDHLIFVAGSTPSRAKHAGVIASHTFVSFTKTCEWASNVAGVLHRALRKSVGVAPDEAWH